MTKKVDSVAFRQWLADPDVRADILTDEPYEGFEDLPFAEDQFAQMVARNFAPMSLGEIANITGYSRERIRQIAEEAMDKERRRRALGLPSILDEYESTKAAMRPIGRQWKDTARKRRQRKAK